MMPIGLDGDALGQRIQQLRKARGFTQERLATLSGVPYATLIKIESGVIKNPSLTAVSKIAESLGTSIDDFVRVQSVRGANSVRAIWKSILEVMQPGEEMLITGINEAKFLEVKNNGVKKFIADIKKRGLSQKLISCSGDTIRLEGDHLEYRWIPENYFSPNPVYVYADRVAMLLWGPPQQAVILRSEQLAETFRRQFMFIWENAKPAPQS